VLCHLSVPALVWLVLLSVKGLKYLGCVSVCLLYLLIVFGPIDLFLLVMEEEVEMEIHQPCVFLQNA